MDLKLWMIFEAVAASEDAVKGSLEDHIEKLSNEPEAEIVEKTVEEIEKVENPHESLDEGFSQVAEVVVEASSFEEAIALVINYGPTYIQLESPDHYEMSLKEGQETLQNVADIMRRYAEMGVGGMLVSKTDKR